VAAQDTIPPPKKHRIKVACDLCHEKKLKCTGIFPCRTCEQQGRLCTAARVANADRNNSSPAPVSAAPSSDINSVVTFLDFRASAEGTGARSGSLNARVHFRGINGEGDDLFGHRDAGARDIPLHMIADSSLDGSLHDSATEVFIDGNGSCLNAHAPGPLYSQAHPSISASFEPLIQAMDVMIQQEDAAPLTSQIEQSAMTTGTTPSRTPINDDFMSLWDEGSYDGFWQSPNHVGREIPSLEIGSDTSSSLIACRPVMTQCSSPLET